MSNFKEIIENTSMNSTEEDQNSSVDEIKEENSSDVSDNMHSYQDDQESENGMIGVKNELSIKEEMNVDIPDIFYPKITLSSSDKYQFKCALCEKRFTRKGTLKRHNESVHTTEAENSGFKVEKSIKNENTEDNPYILYPKITLSLKERKKFQCILCERRFTYKITLQRHKQYIHKSFEDIPPKLDLSKFLSENGLFKCEHCEKQFPRFRVSTFKRHISIHEDNYLCEHCNYQGTSFNFSRHMRLIHEGVKESCNHCNFKTANKVYLKHHMLRCSTKLRKYDCSICKKSFKTKSYVEVHSLSKHEGSAQTHDLLKDEEVFYNCKLCDHKALDKKELKLHTKSIHQVVQYTCHFCDNKFEAKSGLEAHLSMFPTCKIFNENVTVTLENDTEIYNTPLFPLSS